MDAVNFSLDFLPITGQEFSIQDNLNEACNFQQVLHHLWQNKLFAQIARSPGMM